jgi:hypothetical protein
MTKDSPFQYNHHGLHVISDPGLDIRGTHCSSLSRYFPAILKHHHCGNTSYIQLCSNHLLIFCIHFCQPHIWLQCRRRLLEGRRHHLTWPTPGRPEIDYHRDITSVYMLLKISRVQGHRVFFKQPFFTLATGGPGRKPVFRNTIYRTT